MGVLHVRREPDVQRGVLVMTSLLTVEEAATQLRVHPETIRRAIRRGDISAVRIGSVYRVDATEIAPARAPKPERAPRVDASPLAEFVQPGWPHRASGA